MQSLHRDENSINNRSKLVFKVYRVENASDFHFCLLASLYANYLNPEGNSGGHRAKSHHRGFLVTPSNCHTPCLQSQLYCRIN